MSAKAVNFSLANSFSDAGSEKDRKGKDLHVRETHAFECIVCDYKLKNKEELGIHLLTCEIYTCSMCTYRHKRLSELKSHCKTKHTRNTIIRHHKTDRANFSMVSCTNYFSEEILKWKYLSVNKHLSEKTLDKH